MKPFTYPVELTPDEEGGFVISFPDFDEAISQGENILDCLEEASDCLAEAVAGRIDDGEEIPSPSVINEYSVSLPTQLLLKTAIYVELKKQGINNVELAKKLHVDEKAVRRMIDPHHGTRVPTLEKALQAMGKKVLVEVVDQ